MIVWRRANYNNLNELKFTKYIIISIERSFSPHPPKKKKRSFAMNTQTFPQYIRRIYLILSAISCLLLFFRLQTPCPWNVYYTFFPHRGTNLLNYKNKHINTLLLDLLCVCECVVYHFISFYHFQNHLYVYLHFNLLQSDSIIIYTDSLAHTHSHTHNGGCEQSNDCRVAIATTITISMGLIDDGVILFCRNERKRSNKLSVNL